ncbi:hypothetical protein Tco_0428309, partial [Tanacetum coccineum]
GYAQEEGIDFEESFAPVARLEAVVRLGINPMIQPEPEDLPKDNPKLEIAVLRSILTDSKVTLTNHGRMTKPYLSPRFIANCFNARYLKMVVKRQSVKVKEIQKRCISKAFKDYQIKKGMSMSVQLSQVHEMAKSTRWRYKIMLHRVNQEMEDMRNDEGSSLSADAHYSTITSQSDDDNVDDVKKDEEDRGVEFETDESASTSPTSPHHIILSFETKSRIGKIARRLAPHRHRIVGILLLLGHKELTPVMSVELRLLRVSYPIGEVSRIVRIKDQKHLSERQTENKRV